MNTFTHNMIGRMLDPIFGSLPVDVSQQIADFQADDSLQARAEYLASGANEGALSEEEQAEYESYIAAGDIVATIQAIARRNASPAKP